MTTHHDAEPALAELTRQIKDSIPDISEWLIIGIANGGIDLANRLSDNLNLRSPVGILNPLFHRDDIDMKPIGKDFQPSSVPFEIGGSKVLLVDDVFATGRTLRATLNELFDIGRPDHVKLAVLIDTQRAALPFRPDFTGLKLSCPTNSKVHVSNASNDSAKNMQYSLKSI